MSHRPPPTRRHDSSAQETEVRRPVERSWPVSGEAPRAFPCSCSGNTGHTGWPAPHRIVPFLRRLDATALFAAIGKGVAGADPHGLAEKTCPKSRRMK